MIIGKIEHKNNWLILELEHELGRYLRRLFLLTYGIKLQRPSNNEHITIVSIFDKIEDQNVLSKYKGKQVNIEIQFTTFTNGNAYWLNITSFELDEIRKELGLGNPKIPFHFCFGYLTEGKIEI